VRTPAFDDSKIGEIARFANENGVEATVKKYGISRTQVYRFKKLPEKKVQLSNEFLMHLIRVFRDPLKINAKDLFELLKMIPTLIEELLWRRYEMKRREMPGVEPSPPRTPARQNPPYEVKPW